MSQPVNRLARGGAIDRSRPLSFTFDGRPYKGVAGDTLASALLANGVRVVGRSFKYHRPRGIWGSGVDEPNAIVDLTDGHRHDPNAKATLVELADGMVARAVNAWPSARRDAAGVLDRLHDVLPAGFYYKTFIRPTWHLYENTIRRRAGLGRLRPDSDERLSTTHHRHVDVLIVGAGPAGLAALRVLAGTGLRILIVDQDGEPGGGLLADSVGVSGADGRDWATQTVAAATNHDDVTFMRHTTAFGYYDHNLMGLLERRGSSSLAVADERLWKVRARRVILATGAIERPLVFPDNDRPGIMAASAVRHYLHRHAVLCGRRAVVLTNNDSAYAAAADLVAAGAEVTVVDTRAEPVTHCDAAVVQGAVVTGITGKHGVESVRIASVDAPDTTLAKLDCDLLAVSGGWNPTVHLFSQSGGSLRWDEALTAFLPDRSVQDERSAGAARGLFELADCLADGHAAGVATAAALGKRVDLHVPRTPAGGKRYTIQPFWQVDLSGTRQWIDYASDVTAGDVALAARENYISVEHLKRYTTLGMASDQGKTSNVNGLAVLAALTGRTIPEVGTTKFRPPFTPVSLAAIAGTKRGDLLAPLRRLPAHDGHLRAGAVFDEYGGWTRPSHYPIDGESMAAAVARECLTVRERVGLFDGSPLGKIEVAGPDAAPFLDRFYYNEIGTIKPGRIRYCLILNDNGKIYDDGVVARLAADRFLLSPSSSHAAGVHAMLEEWRQTAWPELRVGITNVTTAWATLAVTGPNARRVMERLDTDLDLTPANLPHMAVAEGQLMGVPCRIARVSFTGELGFEISVPAGYGAALFRFLFENGKAAGIAPLGSEALLVLRAEKGYVLVGRDTDGNTEPQDIGMGGPLAKKTIDFVGRRSLLRPLSASPDRLELVGLANVVPGEVLPTGAHVVERTTAGRRSLGYVTSSYASPALSRDIALGIVSGGRVLQARKETVPLFHLGRSYEARIVNPCFWDPAGERLRG